MAVQEATPALALVPSTMVHHLDQVPVGLSHEARDFTGGILSGFPVKADAHLGQMGRHILPVFYLYGEVVARVGLR